MIRVELPYHLRTLASVGREVELEVAGVATQRAILDALEARYPMLSGTIRDHVTKERRAFVRFFACGQDFSNESKDAPLPEAVASGAEPFLVVGAIAGRDLRRTRARLRGLRLRNRPLETPTARRPETCRLAPSRERRGRPCSREQPHSRGIRAGRSPCIRGHKPGCPGPGAPSSSCHSSARRSRGFSSCRRCCCGCRSRCPSSHVPRGRHDRGRHDRARGHGRSSTGNTGSSTSNTDSKSTDKGRSKACTSSSRTARNSRDPEDKSRSPRIRCPDRPGSDTADSDSPDRSSLTAEPRGTADPHTAEASLRRGRRNSPAALVPPGCEHRRPEGTGRYARRRPPAAASADPRRSSAMAAPRDAPARRRALSPPARPPGSCARSRRARSVSAAPRERSCPRGEDPRREGRKEEWRVSWRPPSKV